MRAVSRKTPTYFILSVFCSICGFLKVFEPPFAGKAQIYIYEKYWEIYISASRICCSSESTFVSILCGLTIEIAVLTASFKIYPPSASNIFVLIPKVFLSSAYSICGSVLKIISVCLPDHLSDG